MLFLIFYYFLITFICLWAGLLIYILFRPSDIEKKSFLHFILTGFIGLTSIAQWSALFFPVRITTLFILLIICVFLSVVCRNRLKNALGFCLLMLTKKPVGFYVCLVCLIISILILNAGPILMDDTASYHIQMVKWIQEYGSVSGIANLHIRFGFNSSWFVSIALFGLPNHGNNTYASLNGLLSVWICFYFLDKILSGQVKNSIGRNNLAILTLLIIFILCLLNWPMIRGSATGANYDFITTCCIIVLFTDLQTFQKEIPFEWLFWPMYLFTIRILNFPLILLSCIYIFGKFKIVSMREILKLLFPFSLIIAPFLIRNLILSGYAFFPVYQLDFFSFDWKVDKLKLVEITRYIKYFNRVNTTFQNINITEGLSFSGWIKSWFIYLFRFDKLTIILSAAGYIFLFFRTFKNKTFPFKVFVFVMLCQLVLWFLTAPDPRFVYGPLLFGIFAGFYYVPLLEKRYEVIIRNGLVLTCFFVLAFSVLKVIRNEDYKNYLVPSKIPEPAYQKVVVGYIELHIPEKILNNWNPRCYDIELPCLYKQDPRLEARGKSISDGFRLKKIDHYVFPGSEYKIVE
jgi:hypothetical protein